MIQGLLNTVERLALIRARHHRHERQETSKAGYPLLEVLDALLDRRTDRELKRQQSVDSLVDRGEPFVGRLFQSLAVRIGQRVFPAGGASRP